MYILIKECENASHFYWEQTYKEITDEWLLGDKCVCNHSLCQCDSFFKGLVRLGWL